MIPAVPIAHTRTDTADGQHGTLLLSLSVDPKNWFSPHLRKSSPDAGATGLQSGSGDIRINKYRVSGKQAGTEGEPLWQVD